MRPIQNNSKYLWDIYYAKPLNYFTELILYIYPFSEEGRLDLMNAFLHNESIFVK